MLKKIFAFAGWLLLLCLVFLFCCTLGLRLGWSTVTIFSVWLSMLIASVLLWIILLWLTQLIKEKKHHRFFQKFRLSHREFVLFEHWKTGAAVIKRIQRKHPPIPWYLLLGDRCGKTSLLAGSGLPMFSSDVKDNIVVPTHTLRWWFFHHISFLDLSANFLNGTTTFHRAWGKMVGWIARAPAPSGILIGLSVADLMNKDVSALHEKARQIRAQIAPLTRKLKRQLPLYITVTQCDKFPAFSLWTKQLSAAQRQQVLGYYWPTPPEIDGKDVSMLQPLFTTLKKGFDLARLSMAGTPVSESDNASLLAFPESFISLEDPLRVFLASLCEPNAYFPPATLAGVWFTASEQQDENKSRRTTYFVHDLLMHHLPALSSARDVQWNHNRRLRVVAGYFILLSCVVALGYSALKSTELMQRHVHTLPSDKLADLLMKNETYRDSPLVYLPFSMVLNHQHEQIEQRLHEKLQSRPLSHGKMIATYQQQFINAPEQNKRQMVLDLANTVLTRMAMRDGATLKALSLRPTIPDNLRLEAIDPSASPLARLALERREMQQSTGVELLASLHQLLSVLINYDRELTWLVAPANNLPEVQISDFWPNIPNAAAVSGIWTLQGEAQLTEWVELISLAGSKAKREAILQQFIQTIPIKRQNAWREMLFSVTPFIQHHAPYSLSHNELIAIAQGQSPAMQFARRIAFELNNIPAQHAQPWLAELRRLQTLPSKTVENSLLEKLQQVDTSLRSGLTKWQGDGTFPADVTSGTKQIAAWQKWQSSLYASATEALNQVTLTPELTNGLFGPHAEDKSINPLVTLFASFEQLRKIPELQSQEMGMEAVWSLYQSDARALLGNALSRSGCWLNEQWQSKVLWPMRKNAHGSDYDAQQTLAWQYLVDFVRGPTKGLLTVSDQGPRASEFRGHTIPLTEAFVSMTRHLLNPEDLLDIPQRQSTQNADRISLLNDQIVQLTQQQKMLETKPYSISIISQPATVPEGARMIPTGSRLTLECQSGIKVLDSMNFAEEAQFIWRPGECQRVKLEAKFPYFTATYLYSGNSAWPDFLSAFIRGEALIDTNEFEDNVDIMADLNIKHVLLRFKTSDQTMLQTAWMDWLKLDNQLTNIKEKKHALEEAQQNLKLSSELRGRLSALPEHAAVCR